MSEVETYFVNMVRVLAANSREQSSFFKDHIPAVSNHSAREIPEGRNPLVDLLGTIIDVSPQVNLHGNKIILNQVLELIMLMLSSSESRFWSHDGLAEAPAWELLRSLSRSWLESADQSLEMPSCSIEGLILDFRK